MKRVILSPREDLRIKEGHPWVFDNEVASIIEHDKPAVLNPGEIVDVESSRKEYLGRGFANPHSKILVRLYSPSKEGMDKGFFKRRIREALDRRLPLYDLQRESARIVFGEADFLPGLIIDRFVGWPVSDIEQAVRERPLGFEQVKEKLGRAQSWFSIQFLAFGVECRKQEIIDALMEVCGGREGEDLPRGIIERSDAKVRELEGLIPESGIISGSFPPEGIVIFENGYPFLVHLEEGQKTGHYLDQKENRLRAASLAGNLRVLDVCSNTGGFSIHAGRAGAASVIAVDVSHSALDMVKKNAALNDLSNIIQTREADLFEILKVFEKKKQEFDMIILDPPAFAKSRSVLAGALRGYKEINLRAMRLLSRNGILVTCSCSHAVDESKFKTMAAQAALDAGRRLIQMDFRYQAEDHPILIGYPESLYLKCGIYRVV